jgi:ABC-type nitrate/sulfonate/bicarbonate transport system permease component
VKARARFRMDVPSMGTQRVVLRTLSLVLFALGWELSAPHLNRLLFPTFTETVVALVELLRSPAFWGAMWLSNQALIMGFALASVLGIYLGLRMGRSRVMEEASAPYLNVLLVTPVSALIPIFIIATGLGLVTRVLIVFTFAFVIIVVTVRAGVRTLDPSWIEMATSFGASERQIWRRVLLPGILPALMTALRLGLGRALSGMVAAELLVVAVGLGGLILEFQGNFDSAFVFAAILCVVAEAIALTEGMKHLERRLCGWRSAEGGR